MEVIPVKYADGVLINGVAVIDKNWFLVSVALCGLGRYVSVGGRGNHNYDIYNDGRLKIIGVDMI